MWNCNEMLVLNDALARGSVKKQNEYGGLIESEHDMQL